MHENDMQFVQEFLDTPSYVTDLYVIRTNIQNLEKKTIKINQQKGNSFNRWISAT